MSAVCCVVFMIVFVWCSLCGVLVLGVLVLGVWCFLFDVCGLLIVRCLLVMVVVC